MGKILYNERDGYTYISDNGIKYDLLEGISYKGTTTSDALFIMLSYEPDLFKEIDVEPYQLVDWFYLADDCPSAEFISDYVNRYEKKHPEIVNWFKKKKRITKLMPAELKEMLKKLEDISQCGGIRTYYDKEGREMAEGGLDEYEYSDSTLVHNLMCCCEEVAYALLNEDVDEAEELIKSYAKELMEVEHGIIE